MSTPVLLAIIIVVVALVVALAGRRMADRRSLAAHHRALETMGRLVAQHPPQDPPTIPAGPAGQAHVRLVPESGLAPPPATAGYRSWDEVAPAGSAPRR